MRLLTRKSRAIWGETHLSHLQSLRLTIVQWRQKIEPDPAAHPKQIHSHGNRRGLSIRGKTTDSEIGAVIDLLMLVLLASAFAGAAAYVDACARLLTKSTSAEDVK